jgi:hypothetical protein
MLGNMGCFILRIVADVFFPLRRVHLRDHVRPGSSLPSPSFLWGFLFHLGGIGTEQFSVDAETRVPNLHSSSSRATGADPLAGHSANMGSLLAVAAGKRRHRVGPAAHDIAGSWPSPITLVGIGSGSCWRLELLKRRRRRKQF